MAYYSCPNCGATDEQSAYSRYFTVISQCKSCGKVGCAKLKQPSDFAKLFSLGFAKTETLGGCMENLCGCWHIKGIEHLGQLEQKD